MSVILYTTHCPKCKILQVKMNAKDIKYEMVTDQDLMIEKGFMAAPMLEVDGEVMNFVEANKWIDEQ